mgnify:CR=1 FL=1
MKTVAIVQARMGSTRLPGKVMRRIGGRPMIDILLARLASSERIDEVVVATSTSPKDDGLAAHIASIGYRCFRGSQADVMARYTEAAEEAGADTIVRLTGDNPLVDPEIVDNAIIGFEKAGVDYCSNCIERTYPDGLDVEVFSLSALKKAGSETQDPYDREHVTPYLRESGKFVIASIKEPDDNSDLRWTVDEEEDFTVISRIFGHFAPDIYFGWREVLRLHKESPELFADNAGIPTNEGAEISSGQKLWKRAKKIIPGGNMLLSKRPEMFLPEQWPAYFSKASGCTVWDLDGREYIDMSIMGIGTNILGYGHPEVDDAVHKVIDAGNMSTLNCPEEVWLAEKLIELHPWADMVRFARAGGEANAIAIRIARAASGKDKVAICGYHGWHDWYLSANLADDHNLDGHLLPGLEPRGVPRNLRGTVYPFSYNDLNELEALLASQDIGVIKMEVSRNEGPKPGYLEKVRQLATDRGIVLIFDECTSGFRETFGGLHKKYGVEPDMAMFGKAMGNGYAITATIGRREVMDAAQSSFISSTFWTERIGPTAGLKTLEVMESLKSWASITSIGESIRAGWQNLAEKHGLEIRQFGLPALAGFAFNGDKALEYKTLITQEMLTKGYLAGTSVYACTAHTPEVVEAFFHELDEVFALISECEQGRNVYDLLKGPVCQSGFKRLN